MTTTSIDAFYGVWQLSEWSVTNSETGNVRLPYDGRVDGHLIYSRDRWVSATLMERDRQPVTEDRRALLGLKRRIAAEGVSAIDPGSAELILPYFLAGWGYVSYCGPFRVEGGEVFHEIRNSLIPQWIGTTLVRRFAFDVDEDRLTLLADQAGTVDRLVWRRVRSTEKQRTA
ncbi:MAG: lipocalin-like domain-containing protein [Myxococcota bacterium]